MAVMSKLARRSWWLDPPHARRPDQTPPNRATTATSYLKTAAGTVVLVAVVLWASWLFAPVFLLRVAH